MIPVQGANDDSQLHPVNFVGRAWLFDKIDEWLVSESPILWISGKPGTGKTAAISKWISTRREAVQSGTQGSADVPLAYYYCRRSLEYSRDPFHFVESLAWQAAANSEDFRRAEQVAAQEEASRAGFDIRGEANVRTNYGTAVGVYISSLGARSPRQALRDKFIRPLASLGLERKPFVVIDGLDEASVSGGDGIEKLVWGGEFPADVVRMIITSRHIHRFPVANTVVINLDEFEEENAGDIELYVRELQVHAELSRPHAGAETIASASGGNFLYAKHLLDYPERPPAPSAPGFSRPPDLFEMYKEILRPWVAALDESKKQQWRHEVRPLIGLLAVAQSPGLSSAQLASILGLSQTMIADIMLDIHNLVDGPEWGRGPWQLEHQALVDFLISEEIVIAEESHLLIGEGLVADWRGNWLECADEYALQYALFHLSSAATARGGPRRNTRTALDLIADTVCDSSFLLGAPKEVIYNILMRYTRGLQLSSEAKGVLSLLRRSYYSLGEPSPESRASAVALMAQQLGLPRIAREVAEVVPSTSPYSPNCGEAAAVARRTQRGQRLASAPPPGAAGAGGHQRHGGQPRPGQAGRTARRKGPVRDAEAGLAEVMSVPAIWRDAGGQLLELPGPGSGIVACGALPGTPAPRPAWTAGQLAAAGVAEAPGPVRDGTGLDWRRRCSPRRCWMRRWPGRRPGGRGRSRRGWRCR